MNKSKLSIRVQDIDKVNSVANWCKDNLEKHEWDMTPIHLFKADYKFHFECEKTRIQVILQHL
jgi:CO dehydrogenase/acetyl-CoA synthase delta subunit